MGWRSLGGISDNSSRWRVAGRCPTPPPKPRFQRAAAGARQRGAQHAVGARGHSQTGGLFLVRKVFQNKALCLRISSGCDVKLCFVLFTLQKGLKSVESTSEEDAAAIGK